MLLLDQPVYTIVRYPVSEPDKTGICMKMYDSKNRPVKKIKLRLRLARAQGVLSCVVCVFFLSFVFSLPPFSNPVCDMLESLSAVKARVVREQRERTRKRVRELRPERENIISHKGDNRGS